jgi:hypothetical protein
MKLSAGKINVAALEQGAWISDIPDMGELRLKVRGANNSDWRELERKLIQALPREKKVRGMIDAKDQDAITSECLFQYGLLDWDGFEDDEGKPIPYSKELAREICFHPENMRYRQAVSWACAVVAEEKKSDQDDIVKN